MRVFIFSIFLFLVAPFSVFAFEEIDSFTSDITLNADGTFDVVETIQYDFNTEIRHGIFRYIVKKHPQEASVFFKERYIDIQIEKVTQDSRDVPFDVTESASQVEVKIGDPDKTVSAKHTYTISYKVTGGYSYLNYGDAELYWNVTGNNWNVPMYDVKVTVYAPKSLLGVDSSCYVGVYGQTAGCQTDLFEGGVEFKAVSIQAGQGVTIAQSLNASSLSVLVLERFKGVYLFGMLIPLLFITVLIIGYRYKTKYKIDGPVIAQYEPYQNFKPMYAGVLFDRKLDPRDITAGIVYLAQQGCIKISKIEKKVLFFIEVDDYKITLLRLPSASESRFLSSVLSLLFANLIVNAEVTLSDLKANLTRQKENYKTIEKLRKDLKKDLEDVGFFQVNAVMVQLLSVTIVVFFGVFVFADLLISIFSETIFFGAILIAVFWFISLLFFQERRLKKGYEALQHLKGFKLFLSVTDKERFAFHNAPQKSPEQFMEYLPYAIAFDVEKEWSEAFKDITIPNPSWYDGGSVSTFSAVNLASSLGGFSTAFASSTSSGSSASGGGGFSGGGGGGGGGGSW